MPTNRDSSIRVLYHTGSLSNRIAAMPPEYPLGVEKYEVNTKVARL
jgi:hypothetical protein